MKRTERLQRARLRRILIRPIIAKKIKIPFHGNPPLEEGAGSTGAGCGCGIGRGDGTGLAEGCGFTTIGRVGVSAVSLSPGTTISGKSGAGGVGRGGDRLITGGFLHLCGSSPSKATYLPCGI